jgi:cell wall-associated NlpC family hydrolase
MNALKPGDLIFYGVHFVHHVAMYAGGGKMIEAPNSASRVRLVPIRTPDLVGARRFAAKYTSGSPDAVRWR